jgi:ABC-type antimicrobial peptide transport system permease subunit
LFAYVVGALVAWQGKRTLFSGIQIALSLWLLVVAVIMVATKSEVAPQLLWIEGGYSFLGALLVGVIVGVVPRRVFVKDSE